MHGGARRGGSPMPTGRHSKGRAVDDQGLTRRRFLRAAGGGTAGAEGAAGGAGGDARGAGGARRAGRGAGRAAAGGGGGPAPGVSPRTPPPRRDVVRAGGQAATTAQ